MDEIPDEKRKLYQESLLSTLSTHIKFKAFSASPSSYAFFISIKLLLSSMISILTWNKSILCLCQAVFTMWEDSLMINGIFKVNAAK